jgi:hypothetical protein
MAFIGLVIDGELRRLRLRWGNGFPLTVDYNGLVGGPTGGAAVRSESAVALEVITCAKWESFRGSWRRKAGASTGRDTRFAPHRDSF